jgi:hypothetical protein
VKTPEPYISPSDDTCADCRYFETPECNGDYGACMQDAWDAAVDHWHEMQTRART